MTKEKVKYDPVAAALAARRGDTPPELTWGAGVTVGGDVPEGEAGGTTLREGEQVIYVELSRIKPNPWQFRGRMVEQPLFELMYTIKKMGYQTVLPVRLDPAYPHNLQLAAGHRRVESLRRLIGGDFSSTSQDEAIQVLRKRLQALHDADPSVKHLVNDRIPVVVRPYTDREMMDHAWYENARREPLTPPEEGNFFLARRHMYHLTQEDLASELGVEVTYIKRREAAAKDSPDLQKVWVKPDSMRAVTYLRQLAAAEERAPIIQAFLEGSITTDEVREAVEAVKAAASGRTQGPDSTQEGAREHLVGHGDPARKPTQDDEDATASAASQHQGKAAQATPEPSHPLLPLASANNEAVIEAPGPATVLQVKQHPDEVNNHQLPQTDRERLAREAKLSTALRTLIAYHRVLISSGATPSPAEMKTRGSIEKIVDDIKRAHTPA